VVLLSILQVIVSIVSIAALIAMSFFAGMNYRNIISSIDKLNNDLTNHKKEEEHQDESAIVETTPQFVREKVRTGQVSDEDSAIITVKSPKEVRQAKDAKLQKDLDKITGR
jgi:hypothetical protein